MLEGPGDGFIQPQGNKADTGIARVTDTAAVAVKTARAVPACKHRIEPLPSHEAPAEPLVSDLAFITDKEHWATAMGRGLFAISKADAQCIAAAMKATL